MAVVALAGILLVLRAWNLFPFNSSVVTTDNAYVRGAVTVLAPQVNGYVTEVLVKDYEHVKAGQALDLGYRSTVIADASGTRDLPDPTGGNFIPATELHRAALAGLADRFAIVTPLAALKA